MFEQFKPKIPGLVVAIILAYIASNIGERIPWMGGAACGLAMGVCIASLFSLPARFGPGFAFAGKYVLQLSVILLGAGLNLASVWRTGLNTLLVMLVTISAVFVAAWLLGKALGIAGNTTDLIASGTAICGGSAIAAVAPVIDADEAEISYAISVVFLFNLAAVFIFPLVGHWMNMDADLFGAWAGTAVNDTSSVMAAAYAYNDASVGTATLVKMTRTVMIVPVALGFASLAAWRGRSSGGKFSLVRVFPWFVLGFLAMSLLATSGGIPPTSAKWLQGLGKFLIVVALVSIGLRTDIRKILAAGAKPILLGLALWIVVAVLGLLMLA